MNIYSTELTSCLWRHPIIIILFLHLLSVSTRRRHRRGDTGSQPSDAGSVDGFILNGARRRGPFAALLIAELGVEEMKPFGQIWIERGID